MHDNRLEKSKHIVDNLVRLVSAIDIIMFKRTLQDIFNIKKQGSPIRWFSLEFLKFVRTIKFRRGTHSIHNKRQAEVVGFQDRINLHIDVHRKIR